MKSREIAPHRKVFYALLVLVFVAMLAEGSVRLVLAAVPSERFGEMGDVLVAAGFEQLQTILEPDAERFWRVRPNLDATRLEGRLGNSQMIAFSVSTNSKGDRKTPHVEDPRSDVVFLGDSCTFGVGVEDHETFATLLQQRIPGMRAINAASPGYTAYQGRVTFEKRVWEPPPAAVVVSFMFNDDLPWDGRSDLEHARDRGRLAARLIAHSRSLQWLAGLRATGTRAIDEGEAPRPRLDDAEYAAELRRIVEEVRARGAEAILVAWPLARQMSNDRVTRKQLVMRSVARELGTPFVDLLPHFRAQQAPMFVDAVHANAAGHRLVMQQLEPRVLAATAR